MPYRMCTASLTGRVRYVEDRIQALSEKTGRIECIGSDTNRIGFVHDPLRLGYLWDRMLAVVGFRIGSDLGRIGSVRDP
eukprot:3634990-Pyramimonas_sp.AAC.1